MTALLDIHPANDDERLAAYRNVHDVWGEGLSLEEHLDRRLHSPQHNRARWFVGCYDGRVVTSLGCYPLAFVVRDGVLPGMVLGAVHTLDSYRGRGFARQLIASVEKRQHKEGSRLSLLFSDISPGYYARTGYLRCPSWEGWAGTSTDLSTVDGRGALEPCDPRQDLEDLAATYNAYHRGSALSIERPHDYWRYLLDKRPNDAFYWYVDRRGRRSGYVALVEDESQARIVDFALDVARPSKAEEMYAALLRHAAKQGCRRIGGWLPASAATRRVFHIEPRSEAVSMIKPLDGTVTLDDGQIARTDQICEIDRV